MGNEAETDAEGARVKRYRFLVTFPVEVEAENVAHARRVAKSVRLIGPGPDRQPQQKARINAVISGFRAKHERAESPWAVSIYPINFISRVPLIDDDGGPKPKGM